LIPAARILHDVPLATLAAVLVLVAVRVFHVRDLINIARFDPFELGLTLITLFTVALIGVEQGIAVAVGLAILDRTRLTARPQLHVLGRIEGTTSWAPLSGVEPVAQVPGVLVLLFATPLWYANSAHFRTEFAAAMSRAEGSLALVVLDTIGMSDLDYTGSRVLRQVLDQLDRDHLHFAIARAGHHVRTSLDRSGLLDRIGADHLYPSVDEAVTGLLGSGPTPRAEPLADGPGPPSDGDTR
jgi:SulP family sulfate permease